MRKRFWMILSILLTILVVFWIEAFYVLLDQREVDRQSFYKLEKYTRRCEIVGIQEFMVNDNLSQYIKYLESQSPPSKKTSD